MKRLDIIISERELPSVLKALEKGKVPGYSVMKHVTGKGPNSSVSEDMEFTGLGANAHVIVFCDESLIPNLQESIGQILNYYGGVAYEAEATPLCNNTKG